MTQGRLWEGQAVTEHLTGVTVGAGDAGVTLIFVVPWVPQEGEGKPRSDDSNLSSDGNVVAPCACGSCGLE